ncbi:MAG: hypothetical protein KDC38_21055, partial [Planctomycetes bacterium]|nr:hypothetical protein [Planctomycetota bacterium]
MPSPHVYHVFLASPHDLEPERQLVREYFTRWNQTYGNRDDVRLDVIDCENYSSYGLGVPQELINQQLFDRFADTLILFVGIMGRHFGSPTGVIESGIEYGSGTEAELELAITKAAAAGQPSIQFFFLRC